MTWFPFVSRYRFEDMKEAMAQAVADRDKRIADLERETHRLHDLIYRNNFGVQIYDSIPADERPDEPKLTPAQEEELEFERKKQDEMNRLASIRRTRPSQLAAELGRVMSQDTERRAQAANPGVRQAFAVAHEEAVRLTTVQGTNS